MFIDKLDSPTIQLYQMIDKDGNPSQANHTSNLWVDRTVTQVFSVPTQGNKIEPLTTGKDYFAELIKTCDQATTEIYIAGWQVNWDALLAKGVRLYDLMYRCAKRGVNVYVMPWDDTEPVQTFDDQTKTVLESLNQRLSEEGAKGKVTVKLCPSYAEINNSYFSHHQKQVIVDRKYAFVGGIDIAYGRYDDATYNLGASADGREVLNRYNPGIPTILDIKKSDSKLVDPDLMTGSADTSDKTDEDGNYIAPSRAKQQLAKINNGGWQINYLPAGTTGVAANSAKLSANVVDYTTLDPSKQPRQTWQDVHCKIEGPAVSELLRNFVMRWNTIATKKLPPPKAPREFATAGKARIQVLRSAPSAHCAKENKANNIKNSNVGKQQDIHVAMQQLIRNAARFIYIENQFFVSYFGEIGEVNSADLSPAAQYIKEGEKGISDSTLWIMRKFAHGNADELDRLPQNKILETLLLRLEQAILLEPKPVPFHVYITLPVHPEGALFNASIAVQVFYTMQTIAFGSHSLLKGLKRILKARELKDKKDQNYKRVYDANNSEYQSIPTEACYEYVTLLNLRNWEKLPDAGDKKGERYITEQIYVHSKLMIVDDRFALLGSANINDRSLLGERDSEIAVLVCDDESSRADVYGDGSNQAVRKFAHDLRTQVWKKLFGITGNVRPANNLKKAIKAPGNPASWKAIQKQAQQNAALYEAAFPFVPRSYVKDKDNNLLTASILPTWNENLLPPEKAKWKMGNLSSPMPFQTSFWDKPQHNTSAVAGLSNIKGFITALPVEWTKGENIKIDFPTALIVRNEAPPSSKQDSKDTQISQNKINVNDETSG